MMAVRPRILLAAASVAAILSMAASAPLATAAGPAGGACQLQGVANLSPPLGDASAPFSYNFTGSLTSCQSNVAGAPTQGTVAAGVQVPETVTLTNTRAGVCTNGFCDNGTTACTTSSTCPPVVTTTTGSVLYQEPIAQGNGSCGNSTTSGTAIATWEDGKHSVISYTTTGAAAAVELQGTVVASVTLTLVASSVPAGWTAPATFTISTDEPVFVLGEQSLAALTFSPTTQDQNCVTVGVSSASINGVVGLGSAS